MTLKEFTSMPLEEALRKGCFDMIDLDIDTNEDGIVTSVSVEYNITEEALRSETPPVKPKEMFSNGRKRRYY